MTARTHLCAAAGLAALLSFPVGCRREAVATATPAAPRTDAVDVFHRGVAGIVRVETADRVGMGFVVRRDGIVATTYTVLVGARGGRVVLEDGRAYTIERVLASDEASDVAVVSIAARGLPVVGAIAKEPPPIGARVIAIGHGLGMSTPSLIEATVSVEPDGFWLSGAMLAGFGGAPVLDAHGHVVGMVGAGPVDGVSRGAPAAALSALLADVGRGAGEAIAAFGDRTASVALPPGLPRIDATVLEGCSTGSREQVWVELVTAEEVAVPVYEVGAHEAAFRVLEGATLRLGRELTDCRALLDAFETAVAVGRSRDTPSEGADALAAAYDDTMEMLFATPAAKKRLSMRVRWNAAARR